MTSHFDYPHETSNEIWLFTHAASVEGLRSLSPKELKSLLGTSRDIDIHHIAIFDASDIKEYGLAHYLTEAHGYDVPKEDGAELDALTGTIVIIFSKAFAPMEADNETGFSPDEGLTFIRHYQMAQNFTPKDKLQSRSAQGDLALGKPAKSDARISGMVATFVLLFLALFVTIFIWIA